MLEPERRKLRLVDFMRAFSGLIQRHKIDLTRCLGHMSRQGEMKGCTSFIVSVAHNRSPCDSTMERLMKFSLSSCPSCAHKISKLSIFSSYGLGRYTAPVCSFLMDRSGNPQPSHPGQQGGSLQSQFGRCAAWSTDDPANLLKCVHNQSAIGVFQGHR